MIKKIACFWLLLLSSVSFFLLPSSSSANEIKVIDEANLFSDSQESDLTARVQRFIKNTDMDGVIMTINDAQGKSTRDYAADFYDYNNYGIGKFSDGFIFLIDMDNREFYIVTTGKAKALLSESRINEVLDNAEPYMQEGRYSDAALSVVDTVESFYKKGMPNGLSYNEETGELYKKKGISPLELGLATAAGLGASIFLYSSVSSKYNLKKSTYNYPYSSEGNMSLTNQEDQLYDVRVTRRRIPRAPTNISSGRGGGGGFTGGSGTSHGGGGRSF